MLHQSIVLSSPNASSLAFSPHNLVSLLLQFYLTWAGIKTPCSWMRLQSFCNVIFVPSSCKLNHGSYKAQVMQKFTSNLQFDTFNPERHEAINEVAIYFCRAINITLGPVCFCGCGITEGARNLGMTEEAGVGASIRRSWLDQKMKLREVLSMASFLHIMGGAIGQTP
ncbi:hypothetical protein Peur_011995 [Populus x canadensis]